MYISEPGYPDTYEISALVGHAIDKQTSGVYLYDRHVHDAFLAIPFT